MNYPISIQTFETIIDRKCVYVDKTDLVYELAMQHVCFLSRPRRFGKSLLISTLDSYFSGKKELFKGLKMEELENEWNEYPVFRIDFAGGNYAEPNELEKKINNLIGTWEKQYGKDELCQTISDSFLASIPYEANKDERAKDFETHFSYTFYIINRLLSCYTTLIEKQNSKGRADIIIETDKDVFIFEFKLDKSAKEALEQIDAMQYALPYLNDSRLLHKIGVNISSKSRTVEEWIVEE